jgi:hypothetical protein
VTATMTAAGAAGVTAAAGGRVICLRESETTGWPREF